MNIQINVEEKEIGYKYIITASNGEEAHIYILVVHIKSLDVSKHSLRTSISYSQDMSLFPYN